jgi:hypothetical protein
VVALVYGEDMQCRLCRSLLHSTGRSGQGRACTQQGRGASSIAPGPTTMKVRQHVPPAHAAALLAPRALSSIVLPAQIPPSFHPAALYVQRCHWACTRAAPSARILRVQQRTPTPRWRFPSLPHSSTSYLLRAMLLHCCLTDSGCTYDSCC